MMAGELWRQTFQIGKETTPGTTVAATRKMYFTPDSTLSRERDPRPHRFATASRDNVRAFTLGPVAVGGTVKLPLSASEILELLLIGIKGAVTPTTPGGGTNSRLWTFTPSATLDAATLEWDDGANVWEAGGCYVNKLKFSGAANEEAMVEAEIFGMNLAATTLTGALTDRTPDFMEGWETKVFIDAFEGTPGTTQVTGTLVNWEVEIDNQMGRKYFAANTNATGAVTIGELEVKAKLTIEASASQADTEFTNWNAATKRLIRLDHGNNELIEGALYKFVTIDLPGAWEAFDLGGEDEGTRVYELSLQYVYDPTNAFGLQIRAQNARTAAY
ncbi:MAG: hypothetical protein HC804_00115 [Anaerolineae bacterium]|nr:hypothetical protein [Anaerolineae bacterium]